MSNIKLNVKSCRVNAQLTKSQMAEKLGMSERQYQDREDYVVRWYVEDAIKFANEVGIPLCNIIWSK